MRRNSFLAFLKEKSFIIVLALMLISAGTMAALFSLGEGDQTEENQVAQQEETESQTAPVKATDTKEKEEITPSVETETFNKAKSINGSVAVQKQSETATINGDHAVATAELEDQYLEAPEMAEVSTSDIVAEGFTETPTLQLQWPVEGEVVLEFAMDHSIYFPTLAQYQYNPAMIISVSEGTEVLCAASGTVIEVGKTNEYGHYVTMDLGNGFEITYGQLFDITTEVGEILEAGERIALVAYPTRNYTAEGENLYLKLTHDDMAVDPKIYLK